jgi:hypothetical protein
MSEPKRRSGRCDGKPKGSAGAHGRAAIAMVGALATVHPANALVALSEVVPRLARCRR